jgi:hypothetical protein
MQTVFNKAQATLEENGWQRDAFREPHWHDSKYRVQSRWGSWTETDWIAYERDAAAYLNRARGRVATRGAVLGFPHSYEIGGRVAYCMRGAMGESAMMYPLGFPHPFKMAFANKVSRRMYGDPSITVLVFNDQICRTQEQAIAFLGECDRQWRQRGLRKYWQRYIGWLGSGGHARDDLPIPQSVANQVTVPDGLIDGWPPDQVPPTWAQEESLV